MIIADTSSRNTKLLKRDGLLTIWYAAMELNSTIKITLKTVMDKEFQKACGKSMASQTLE
ncbi:hypothetical protein D3C80_2172530 [compost metagenome]